MNNIFLAEGEPRKIIAKDHADWLALRRGIGSSDVATILGLNKYCTPYQLWLQKTDKVPREEQESFLMMMGHELEPIIAKVWSKETGFPVIEGSEEEYIYVHPQLDFLRASPDREFMHPEYGRSILECKSTQLTIEADNLPPYWFCQVQYQLGIAQLEYSNIAWMQQAKSLDYAAIHFNPDFFKYMVDEVSRFWYENVVGGKEPDMSNVQDIALKYQYSEDKCVEASERLLLSYDRLCEVREALNRLTKEEDSLKEAIQLTMLSGDRLVYEGKTLCTWKSAKNGVKFDEMRFKELHPDLYQEFLRETVGSRRFLVKRK